MQELLNLLRKAVAMVEAMIGDVSAPVKPTGTVEKTVKLAIVVGHNAKYKGAYSATLGSEYDFNTMAASYVAAAAKGTSVDVEVFYRTSGKNELKHAYENVDKWGADCSIELHFNSFDGPATGTETLHSTSKGSTSLAKMVQVSMLDSFGLPSRGLILRKRYAGRGWLSMYSGNAPAILIEPGFGSHPDDATSLKKNWPVFAKDLIKTVSEWKAEQG